VQNQATDPAAEVARTSSGRIRARTGRRGVRDENGRVKSRPDPSRVLHLTRPFSHSQKKPET
jgi:hypothetical protein